jgi:hypothetical protein
VKDCSYVSFSEEIDVGGYIIGEKETLDYKEEIIKEVNDIGYDSVGIDISSDNVNNESRKHLISLYDESINDLRNKGKYILYGTIIHSGSSTGGHYHTYIRKRDEEEKKDISNNLSSSSSSSLWYHFDDEKVNIVKWEKYIIFIFIIIIIIIMLC